MAAENPVHVNVNGTDHEFGGEPDTPLLYALRDDLGLVGTRFGCGVGLCGACFVLLDGHPTPSCDTPLWAADGKRVVTVEGLGDTAHPSALQRAFLDQQAAQCGYCVSGILVSATALLEETPRPTEHDVRSALDRNLCRCGAHNRMVRAVMQAAGEQEAAT
ncbi:MAG: 2Fe-2S iron-sulfur cluster binding domain-containing protein [Streptosporangiales bacterium]|nr:2Fe-2S iron-sulfur cluster binding domain-containing protein [Streptosporangiales bacterium]